METGEMVNFGPFGGPGGDAWNDGVQYTGIREITIHVNSNRTEINSIQVIYDLDGKSVTAPKHGTLGGTQHLIRLNYPAEYLVEVSGYHTGASSRVINSLLFRSNTRVFSPINVTGGTSYFICKLAGAKVVGFFGRSSAVVDQIGVRMKPLPPVETTKPSVGPFGTNSGQTWDDGMTYRSVREIIVYSGEVIDSLQFFYEDTNGNRVVGAKQGGAGGGLNTVKLEADEYLLSFSGYFGQVGNIVYIRSLTFQSNKKTHGPYGLEDGEKFAFPSTGAKIIGFFGRTNGGYLNSIGAYLDK